jgi:Cu(I)/Ag(I) efflux system membrane fusion protein
MGGEIAEKMVTQGQAVRAGANLFLIADRKELWVDLAVFETDMRLLRVGMPVEVTVDAFPGQSYQGRVNFIHPVVDSGSRTLTARVAVHNRGGRLRPGMYATARLASATTPRLVVPLTAVLPTGTRNIVFVNRGDGRFVPLEVAIGSRGDSLVEIVRGLEPGDEVVASATYLLDSESNLAAAMQGLMLQMGMGLDMGGMQR